MHANKLGNCYIKFLIVLTGLLLLFTVGCIKENQSKSEVPIGAKQFIDSTGYRLELPQKPKKIVSLSIGADEILIGLVAPERIAALTYWSDDSGISNICEQAKTIPRKVRANTEEIIALQPDLVVIPDWQPSEFIQSLREAGIPVFVYKSSKTIDEVKQSITIIAHLVGEEQAGGRLVANMEEQLTQIDEKIKQVPPDERRIVVRFSLMGGGDGKGSMFDDICRYSGVRNGAAAAGLGANEILSKEQVVAVNPDVILLPLWDYTGKTDMQKFGEEIQGDPALQTVKAIFLHNLIPLPDKHLYCTSQYIVQGVRDVAKAAYPQYFKEE